MQGRTFIRIMFDNLFVNNALCKAIVSLVNFCKEQGFYYKKDLKFSKKMPLDSIEVQKRYKNKFIFESKLVNGANSK